MAYGPYYGRAMNWFFALMRSFRFGLHIDHLGLVYTQWSLNFKRNTEARLTTGFYMAKLNKFSTRSVLGKVAKKEALLVGPGY